MDYPELNSVPKCKMCGYDPTIDRLSVCHERALEHQPRGGPPKGIIGPKSIERLTYSQILFKMAYIPKGDMWPTKGEEASPAILRACPRCGYAWHERTLEDE